MVQKPYLFANDHPGRRADVLALAREAKAGEAKARGFPGVFSESPRDNLALSLAVMDRAEHIVVGTGIAGIYLRHPHTMATGASLVAELHPGRFLLGLGTSHAPFHEEMGLRYGRPLEDMRGNVQTVRSATEGAPRVLRWWWRRCAGACAPWLERSGTGRCGRTLWANAVGERCGRTPRFRACRFRWSKSRPNDDLP